MLHAYEITPEMKDEFISLIYEGHRPNTAAKQIGTTGTVFRRLKNKRGAHYDPDFAQRWHTAETSDEHRQNRADRLRDQIDERSETSDNVLIKRAMAELPEWEPLRHQNFHHDYDIKVLARALPGLTEEELNRAIEAKEAEQAALNQQPLRAITSGE